MTNAPHGEPMFPDGAKEDHDPLRAATGIGIGCLIAFLFWSALALAAYLCWR